MRESTIFSGCGTLCDECEYHKGEKTPKCPGCHAMKGKPFWGTCHTYSCLEEHEVEHCGLCNEFPCDKFIDTYDPSHGPKSAVTRAGILSYRAKHGDEKAVALVKRLQH